MKKRFGIYAVAWTALLVLFNVIAFVSVGWIGQDKYTSSFWIGYGLITLMFAGQLLCTYFAFRADTMRRLFYNVSLIKTSYGGLIASFIVGGICMLLSPLAYWIGAIACAIVLAVNVIAVVKASAAVGVVEEMDKKTRDKTLFVQAMTLDAETLMKRAPSEATRAECKRVYDAVRYSDPVSSDALASVEAQITIQFHSLTEAVEGDDAELSRAIADNLTVLVDDRNRRCKLLK